MSPERGQLPLQPGPSGAEPVDNTGLVRRCLDGDVSAWNRLVERYAGLVHSIPVRYRLTPMEVDDVGQEVFLSLAQNLHQLEDPERLPAWLITTARRQSWRALQKRNREQVVEAADLSEAQSDRPPGRPFLVGILDVENLVAGWQRQEALQAGLARLGDRCRRLLFLLFLDQSEPSYDDIGRELGMAKGSIGPTRNRCLQQLRSILEGLGYGDLR